MLDYKQGREAIQINASAANNPPIGESFTLVNFGPACWQVHRVRLKLYLRRIRETAADRIHGLLNRVKRHLL